MGRRLYVGNLPYKATDEELTTLFSTVGDVASARVMRDMATGRARGFGFVEMTTDEAAAKAIEKLHQHQMDGRAIVVNEAQPKPAGGGRSFGGGGGGFNRGRRGRAWRRRLRRRWRRTPRATLVSESPVTVGSRQSQSQSDSVGSCGDTLGTTIRLRPT